MSGELMMTDFAANGNQLTSIDVVSANEDQAIRLEFIWGKSCFKGKYPKWTNPRVTQLLHDRGLSDERLAHELMLFQVMVNESYGCCIKCFAMTYIMVLFFGLAAIAAQFALPDFRQHFLSVLKTGEFDLGIEFLQDIGFLILGLLLIILFFLMFSIHRICWSKIKYKKTMKELKDNLYGFDLQNKYNLVKWVHKLNSDSIQFDIIIIPLQRENNKQLAVNEAPEMAMSTVSI